MTFDAEPFTDTWYRALPELYRTADMAEPSGGGQPLLRFLDLLGAQAGEIRALGERAGDLVDPAAAEAEWLPWLAQLVGIQIPQFADVALWRDIILTGAVGWAAGTPESIRQAVLPVLVDDGLPPNVSVSPDPTTPFTINVSVAESQSPGTSIIEDAIVAAGAKPAGHVLVCDAFYTPPWDLIDAGGDWDGVDGLGPNWEDVDSTV